MGYNQIYADSTKDTNQTNLQIAQTTAASDEKVAAQQSMAVIMQARYDYEARIYEANKNYDIQMKALDVRLEEAKLQYKTDHEANKADMLRAEASMTAATAKVDQADTADKKVEYKHDEAMAKYSDDDYSSFYG